MVCTGIDFRVFIRPVGLGSAMRINHLKVVSIYIRFASLCYLQVFRISGGVNNCVLALRWWCYQETDHVTKKQHYFNWSFPWSKLSRSRCRRRFQECGSNSMFSWSIVGLQCTLHANNLTNLRACVSSLFISKPWCWVCACEWTSWSSLFRGW